MKKTFLVLSLLSVIVTIIAIIQTKELCVMASLDGWDSEFSNYPPGKQGQRQQQAVQCFSAWNGMYVTVGCCFGSEQCNDMNPCDGKAFSCDSNEWIEPETGNGNGK